MTFVHLCQASLYSQVSLSKCAILLPKISIFETNMYNIFAFNLKVPHGRMGTVFGAHNKNEVWYQKIFAFKLMEEAEKWPSGSVNNWKGNLTPFHFLLLIAIDWKSKGHLTWLHLLSIDCIYYHQLHFLPCTTSPSLASFWRNCVLKLFIRPLHTFPDLYPV